MNKNTNWIRIVLLIVCVLGITLWISSAQGLFKQTDKSEIFKILSDAFFIPGVLVFGMGALIWCGNEGTFDMLAYGVRQFFGLFKRNPLDEKYKSFYDYREAKKQRKKSFGYLLIIGGCCLALSALFAYLYYV